MIRGFAVNLTQEDALVEHGVLPNRIYFLGRNKESLAAAIASFRGEGGELMIAADLRIFGTKRKEILAVTDKIEAAGIKIVDVREPKASLSKLIDFALSKTAGDQRWAGAKRTAKVTGRRGGKRKAEVQELRRAAVAHEDVVRRLCECEKLSWRDRAAILGPPFSVATLRRRYT